LDWINDLKQLHRKQKLSVAEINNFILEHPNWAASIISNALGFEMYRQFCLYCQNFGKCCEKLGTIKMETRLGCICNEFLNIENSDVVSPRLSAYVRKVAVTLNL